MRYLLLLCTIALPLGAIAQSEPVSTPIQEAPTDSGSPPDQPSAEVDSTPAPQDAETPVSIQISDQDFLLLPEDPAPAPADTESTLSGEVIVTEETFVEPMEFEDAAPPPVDPRTLAASSEAEERRLKIRYKQARLKAEKNTSLVTLLDKAKTARTFEAERAAYRAYYRELFKLMRKSDSSISKLCDLMEKTYLTKLAQTRIEPTIPLEPPPKPELLAN